MRLHLLRGIQRCAQHPDLAQILFDAFTRHRLITGDLPIEAGLPILLDAMPGRQERQQCQGKSGKDGGGQIPSCRTGLGWLGFVGERSRPSRSGTRSNR